MKTSSDPTLYRDEPEASVLIPCFNGGPYLERCLQTLFRSRGVPFEIIVVDNASTDRTLRILQSYPEVKVIRNKSNAGFPVAVNQAAHLARGEFLVILNVDTEVDPDWLFELVSVLKSDPEVAICGSRIVDARDRNTVQQLGVMVDKFGFGIYILHLNRDIQEVFMVSATALAVKRGVFNLVGGLDEEFFIFEEDLDFCWRVRLAGYKVMVNSRSSVYHTGGSAIQGGFPGNGQFITTPLRRYLSERNTLQTLLKNYHMKNILVRVPPYLGMNLIEIAMFSLLREIDGITAYLRSLYYNVVNFKRTWQKHVEVDRTRRIDDDQLSALQENRNLKISAFMQWGVPTFKAPSQGS